MPAKHAIRLFGPARLVLSFAVAILVLLVVWIAVRAVGPAEASRQPTVVLPSMPQVPEPSLAAVPVVPSSVPTVEGVFEFEPTSQPGSVSSPDLPGRSESSPSPRPSSPVPATSKPPAAKPTTKAPATTPPPAADDLSVVMVVTAGWDQGYVAALRVTNEGDKAADWKVTVSHKDLPGLRLQGVWNAAGTLSGKNIVLTGTSLAPGRSATIGYQAGARDRPRPSACSAVGGRCSMR